MPLIGVLDGPLDMAFSGNTMASSTAVPVPYVISINGRTYLEDLEFKPWKRQAMRFTTTTITRTQADTSNEPGEQSLSTDSLWRRTQDSWHLGAAQVYLDRKNSSEFQYRSSKGMNPWTQWQLSLLNDTASALSSANTNLEMAICGSHLYVIDGQLLKYTTDLTSWTTVTGNPAVTASSICSDGHTVYVAYGASGIYSTTEGAGSQSQYVTSAIDAGSIVRFVMGRLMVNKGTSIYNIIATGALPTALFTSNYSNFVWTDFTEGNGVIFAAGNCGDKAVIYSIQINTDATALSAPIVCGQLPNGENIECLYGYAGSGVALGTSLGWRFSEQALANGVAGTVALTIGPLVNNPGLVGAFSGYSRFIWFTWSNYDGTSTGLGRMDPSQFTADLVPAFASDIMATAQGTVNSIVHFGGNPVFSVSGQGVYKQATTYVAAGNLQSGLITYGIADNKMPVFVDVAMQSLVAGTVTPAVSLNSANYANLGVASVAGTTTTEFAVPQTLSTTIEIQETLTSGNSNTVTPVLTRHTLRSVPAPPLPTDMFVVIQLRERVRINDNETAMVPSFEWGYLNALCQSKVINNLQIGNMGPFQATLENIDWIPEQKAVLTGELNGVCVLNFRTVV